jgi:hypothetical protein
VEESEKRLAGDIRSTSCEDERTEAYFWKAETGERWNTNVDELIARFSYVMKTGQEINER